MVGEDGTSTRCEGRHKFAPCCRQLSARTAGRRRQATFIISHRNPALQLLASPQDDLLRRMVSQYGAKSWKKIGAATGRLWGENRVLCHVIRQWRRLSLVHIDIV
jgi:hypothetical protein